MSSIWRSTLGSSRTPEALAFSRTCSGRVAPMIAAETFGFCSVQATASWASVRPGLLGDRLQQLHLAEDLVGQVVRDEAGAALVGRP